MFTGIVQELGQVISLNGSLEGAQLTVATEKVSQTAKIGDSIAVNGVCLTVVTKKDNLLIFDLSKETLKVTNLGELKPGEGVNLEPALKVGDPLGGHFVLGHVDEVGKIKKIVPYGENWLYEIAVSANVLNQTIPRGSITVDGISLTVTKLLKNAFQVVIIPHTAKVTNLSEKKVGSSVNIEIDMISKYLVKIIKQQKEGGTSAL